MAAAAPQYNLSTMVVTIPQYTVWPTVVTPPPDRRHKWVLTSEGTKRRWFRCSACGRRRSVTALVSLIGARMVEAERATNDYLNAHLFGRGPARRSRLSEAKQS